MGYGDYGIIADESLIRHKAIMDLPSWRLVKHKPVVQAKFHSRVLTAAADNVVARLIIWAS